MRSNRVHHSLFTEWRCSGQSALLALVCLLSGCQYLRGQTEAPKADPEASAETEAAAAPAAESVPGKPQKVGVAARPSKAAVDEANANDQQLKLAKLWARVDELENQQIQQKERVKLLEKGLMLGIIPDELLHKGKGKAKSEKEKPDAGPDTDEEAAPVAASQVAPAAVSKADEGPKSQDLAEYRRRLIAAQEKFNAAQYGQAIVHFNELAERFDESVTEGNENYWIGICWYYLKEYQLAEQSFKVMQERFAKSPWAAHARFYQAKIDQTRGMNQRALSQFKALMEEFANQDLGEMARMEVARMTEKL